MLRSNNAWDLSSLQPHPDRGYREERFDLFGHLLKIGGGGI